MAVPSSTFPSNRGEWQDPLSSGGLAASCATPQGSLAGWPGGSWRSRISSQKLPSLHLSDRGCGGGSTSSSSPRPSWCLSLHSCVALKAKKPRATTDGQQKFPQRRNFRLTLRLWAIASSIAVLFAVSVSHSLLMWSSSPQLRRTGLGALGQSLEK